VTQMLEVFVPTGIPPLVELKPMAHRLGTLDGKRIAFLNAMFDVTGTFLDELQAYFKEHFPTTKTFVLEIENSQGDGVPVAERGIVKDTGHLERIKAEADGAVIALGLCASCTQAVAGTAMSLETEYGVPAVAVHNGAFRKLTEQTAKTRGMPYLRQVYTPSPVVNLTAPELRAYIEGPDPVNGRPFMDVLVDGLVENLSNDEIEAARAAVGA
jgi:hypothetical protein